jgi:tRNA-dihydrouridine synthase C
MKKPPKLYLAPMEGVATSFFRKAIAQIGGFDECCTEFIRVPINALCKSLAKVYKKNTTHPIPQAAQIMGSDPILLQEMAQCLAEKGAPRVDLNCGCPSNVVTGKGAGSSLLKTPDLLYEILSAMKRTATVPITAKIRSGYEDTRLLKENLLAVQSAGCDFITIHPRTKVQGYTGKADWTVIQYAKQLLQIPVVGNGDIETVDDALRMLELTNCDALMIGRGALKNPWIFHEIKKHFNQPHLLFNYQETENYIRSYISYMPQAVSLHGKISMLKQLFGYFFWTPDLMQTKRKEMLREDYASVEQFLERNLPALKTLFEEKG